MAVTSESHSHTYDASRHAYAVHTHTCIIWKVRCPPECPQPGRSKASSEAPSWSHRGSSSLASTSERVLVCKYSTRGRATPPGRCWLCSNSKQHSKQYCTGVT